MDLFLVLCCTAAVFLAVYYHLTSTFHFWESRGVRGPRPQLFFGTLKDVVLLNRCMNDYLRDMYNKYKTEPMFGIFVSREPVLVIKSPELIKDVLITDFPKFADRGIVTYEKVEPISQHLFDLEPKRWRPLRTQLTPAFTPAKLKEMFVMISQCADQLEDYLENVASKKDSIECRELMAKYTTDVIGTCAFGIEINALADENSEFLKIGKYIFAPTWSNMIRFRLRRSLPWLFRALAFVSQSKNNKFFIQIVSESIVYREKNNIVKNDFIDILRELKKHPEKLPGVDLTESLLASQAFVFFAAGFETSSATMSNAMYELALNRKVQYRLRKEIEETYAKYGSNLTYENVKSMSYLDTVFKETLRKYPPVTFLLRQSTEAHTFDGTSVTISKGQKIWIPVYALQRDPDIYTDPDVFDPERFEERASQNRNPMFYLPFGDGPRNCIGARFAVFQTKIGLIKVFRNYKVETCEKTQPYVIDPKAFLLMPVHGIYLKISKVHRS